VLATSEVAGVKGGAMRRECLGTGEIYHVCNKSIAGFRIFNNDAEFLRIRELMQYYQVQRQHPSFSKFKESGIQNPNVCNNKKLVQIICHSPMPTHIHLTLKQLIDKGISIFMGNLLNSYSRYFNIKHNRKGPLWEGRFKAVLVQTDEQLLHLTRYIHLNPVTARLVDKPEDWLHSSYREYVSMNDSRDKICQFDDLLDICPAAYKEFTEDRISYQRELAKIKNLLLD